MLGGALLRPAESPRPSGQEGSRPLRQGRRLPRRTAGTRVRQAHRERPGPGDEGSAVVEFTLVTVLLLMLLLAIAQVAVYLHVRNVTTASAAEGARWGANADVPAAEGGPRAQEVLGRALGSSTAGRVRCTAEEQGGPGGAILVRVRCAGAVPVFFAPLGDLLPVDVEARALEEGA